MNKKFFKKGGVCRCCGTMMVDGERCNGTQVAKPCKYFGLDPKEKFGSRFRCRAEGRADGNCSGELEHVYKMMNKETRERVEKFYRDEIEPNLSYLEYYIV